MTTKHQPATFLPVGRPFTSAELQVMASQGLLRLVLPGLYGPAWLAAGSAGRAQAAAAELPASLRSSAVLCGETAAWVHLGGEAGIGGAEPHQRTVSVISAETFRRPTAESGRWRIHQVPVRTRETVMRAGIRVTNGLRTAADLVCGNGTAGSRRPVDALHQEFMETPSDTGEMLDSRLSLITQLIDSAGFSAEEVAAQAVGQMGRTRHDPVRERRITELLVHGASRRLPTVR